MKNILIILFILILPIVSYLFLSEKNSSSDVVYASGNKPTLLLFSSTMCLDCQRIKKEIEKIEPLYKDKVEIIKITATDKQPKTNKMIKQYGVTLVPTAIFIDKNKNIKFKNEGYMSFEDIKANLESLLNG